MLDHENPLFQACWFALKLLGRAFRFRPLEYISHVLNSHGFGVTASGCSSLFASFVLDTFHEAFNFGGASWVSPDFLGLFVVQIGPTIFPPASGPIIKVRN